MEKGAIIHFDQLKCFGNRLTTDINHCRVTFATEMLAQMKKILTHLVYFS